METVKQKTLGELEEKLNTSGSAYARVTSLFDAGTFVELGKFVKGAQGDDSDFEGVVTGYGAVDGKLVFCYSQDFSRTKGAVTSAHADKIAAIYEAAVKNGAPVISIIDTAGALITEGVGALSGYGRIMSAVAKASGIIPQIAVIAGQCTGAMATIASMADITIGAVKGGKFFIAPPFDLGDKSGTIEAAAKNGSISIKCESDEDAVKAARKLVSLLPSNNVEGVTFSDNSDDALRETAGTTAFEISASTADNGSEVELLQAYGKAVKTSVATINGITVGTVSVNGKLTPCDARKAAKFVSFCDNFSIPVVTFVNCEGFEYSSENEKAPFASELSKLAMVYASSTNAKVTVVTGTAIGSAFTILGSKALGADITLAVKSANIATMTTQAALEFVYSDEIYGKDNALENKKNFEKQWNENVASPVCAARNGDLDDVIENGEIRARVASALEMLSGKACKMPYRKHGNMPL